MWTTFSPKFSSWKTSLECAPRQVGNISRVALRPLSRVPAPTKAQYEQEGMVIHLAGFGVFPVKVIGAVAITGEGVPCWGVLTFVDREPRQDECAIATIGPEQ